MKRKFISAILFGALLVAPASVFVSCSDYDDDIKSLQGQTDALKTQLAEQEAALEAALAQHNTDFEAAKAAAQNALDAARAAQSTGDQALAEAQAAKADAALASQAAAQAKADAIAEAQSLVAALRQEIEDKGYATQANLDAAVARIASVESELLKLKDIPTEVGNIKVTVNEHTTAIEALQTQMKAVEKYKELIDTNASDIKALTNRVTKAEEAIDKINETIETLATQAGLNEAVDKLNERIDGISDQVTNINAQLVTLQTSKLRALVFVPNLYAGGIEAAEYGYLTYETLTGKQHDKGANAAGQEVTFPEVEKGGEATLYDTPVDARYYPVVDVKYHLNPSSAVIKAGQLSFVSRDVQVISREGSKANPTVERYSQAAGVLTVGMKVDGYKISNDPKDANIFALQANIKNGTADTTITSDYAMLYASYITPEAIAFSDNQHGGKKCTGAVKILNNELYTDPVDALKNDAAFCLEFDDAQGFDIAKILETHYAWDSQTRNAVDHGKWATAKELAAYGLHYDYSLIYYSVKGNSTSDSKYATLNGSVIKASAVDAKGEPTGVQDQSSIGREPLVKVTVKDEDGKVVLYGFIKVSIVREIGTKVTEEFAWNDQKVDYCNALVLKTTWSEISARVLSLLGMSNEEFNTLYVLDGVDNGTEIVANQYVPKTTPAVDGTEFELAKSAQVVGEVVETLEPEGQRTSIIEWTISEAEQAAIYEGSASHSKTIYVAYVRRNAALAEAKIYLPLTVTFVDRDGAKAMASKKLENYWKWGADKQPGINVPQPYDGGNTRSVSVNIKQVFEGDKIVFPADYQQFVAKGNYAYYFLPSQVGSYQLVPGSSKILHKFNGQQYNPSAANEEKYAIAARDNNDDLQGVYGNDAIYLGSVNPNNLIATIDQTTGEITYYRPSAEPYTAAGQAPWYELLNAYGTTTLAEPQAFLKVSMAVWNDCGVVSAIVDDNLRTFNEYLLRPINVASNGSGVFVDAQANYSSVNLLDLLDFSDWRFEKFVDLQNNNYKNAWLFGFYRVLKCEVDLNAIQTNMNQANPTTFAKLSAIAPRVEVEYLPGSACRTLNNVANVFAGISTYAYASNGTRATYEAIRDGYFGKLQYKNNGTPIGYFTKDGDVVKDGNGNPYYNVLRVPVKITYDWGVLATVWVDIKIEPSGATASNRK